MTIVGSFLVGMFLPNLGVALNSSPYWTVTKFEGRFSRQQSLELALRSCRGLRVAVELLGVFRVVRVAAELSGVFRAVRVAAELLECLELCESSGRAVRVVVEVWSCSNCNL